MTARLTAKAEQTSGAIPRNGDLQNDRINPIDFTANLLRHKGQTGLPGSRI